MNTTSKKYRLVSCTTIARREMLKELRREEVERNRVERAKKRYEERYKGQLMLDFGD